MRLVTAAILFSIVYPNALGAENLATADDELTMILDRVWDFELIEDPMLATNVGDPRGQDRLADESIDAIERRAEMRRGFLSELTAIAPSELSPLKQIDQELLRLRLEGQLADFRFRTHEMGISNREGFHISFPELPRVMSLKSKQDFRNYVSRLNDFGRYVDQQIELLRAGIESRRTQPAIIMRGSLSQVEAHVVSTPKDSVLLTNITAETRSSMGEQEWSHVSGQIEAAIRTSVVPGYERFRDFLQSEYLPACRGSIAADALPDGREFYQDRVERFTTLSLSPDEIHATGMNEVSRIRSEMDAIRKSVHFEGNLGSFLEHLRTDPKFYAKSSEELMQRVALILKTADGRLPDLFGRLPRIPYGIREVPTYVAPQTTAAYYWPPSTDGKRAGYYYVNTYNLSTRPLYQLESLSLHEAVPGHHLQLALQAELSDLHPISRESRFTAFIEGWALYSERLGKEMGFYQDPYQDFGRLSMEAWRASRLVVDTGIHRMGWTRGRAIDFMKANTALGEHDIVAEVDRYIGWPGQALAYKIGELAISRMRQEAEAKLGNRFDIRAFHDSVLDAGSIPLPLLESRIEQWIATQ